MALSPRTKSGKLSDLARHVVLPSGIVSTAWPSVREKCLQLGLAFDPWQDGAGRAILAKRADGTYAASVGGAVLSIPRQVGKTYLLGAIVFAVCILHPGQTVIWTAHRSRTADETFESMRSMAKRKKIAPSVEKVLSGGGEGSIIFRNGSRVLFGARESGFGRGFAKVTLLVFDEAQILTMKAMEDMIPAANQGDNALVLFAGTPPRPIDPGEVFKSRRREALSGEDEDTLYIEFSADREASLDDRKQWLKANPSYPHRTSDTSILRMRKMLGSDESFKREALGIWDEDQAGSRAISESVWDGTGVESAPAGGFPSYGVAFSFDGSRVSLAGGFLHEEDRVHVELIDADSGLGGLAKLADWFCEKNPQGVQRWRGAGGIVIGGSAGAGVLRQLLIDRRVPSKRIRVVNTPQYLQACAMFYDSTKDGSMSHLSSDGQRVLDESVAVVDRDKRGGWMATVPDADETPVEAVSLALWGARSNKRRARADGERKGAIL